MRIFIELKGILKKFNKKDSDSNRMKIDLAEGISISDLLEKLEIPGEYISLISVNDITVNKEQVLKDGDKLKIFPPVGGG